MSFYDIQFGNDGAVNYVPFFWTTLCILNAKSRILCAAYQPVPAALPHHPDAATNSKQIH